METHQMQGDVSVLAGKRVVVCEDDSITQLQLGHALSKSGMEVVGQAATGAAAVELILAERPDIVIMDIALEGVREHVMKGVWKDLGPGGRRAKSASDPAANTEPPMDGWEASRLVLDEYAPCIIILSGLPDSTSEHVIEGADNIAGYIPKPVGSGTLLEAVADIYGQFISDQAPETAAPPTRAVVQQTDAKHRELPEMGCL
jgi:DNA-binding NarL/FixJ family response regulator